MAAAGTIAEFLASVGFKADGKSLKSALAKVAAFGVSMQAIAAGVTAGIMRVAEAQVAVARDAEKLRTSTERLEELRYVAEQTGAQTGALDSALQGLGSKYPRIKDTSVLFERMGRAMRGMTEEQRRAYAQRMGIDPTLIPMMTQDVSGLSAEFREMYALAGTDAKAATEASRGFLAEIGKLKTLAVTLAKAVSLAFIGRIRGDIEHLRRVIVENFGKVRAVLEFIISIVLRVSGVISAFVYRAVKTISALVDWFGNLDEGTRKLIIGAGLLLAAWKLLNMGFLATPLGALIAGLAAVVALVDDYLTYMEGGESLFDWGPWAGTIQKVLDVLRPLAGVLLAGLKGAAAAVGPLVDALIAGVSGIIDTFRQVGQLITAVFSGDFSAAADAAIGIVNTLASTITNVIGSLVEAVKTLFSAMWAGVQESFPDFAAWAASAAQAITGLIGKALDWVKEKLAGLLDYMPDWIKEKMGMGGSSSGSGKADAPGKSASAPAPVNDFDPALGQPALTPGPAQAAAMTQSNNNVNLESKTDIHISTTDPIAAGNQAAAAQQGVNADLVRNAKGAAR
jgi:hypothetical protein